MWGVKVRTAEMKRSLWLSPRSGGATRLRVHASSWPTREAAQAALDALKSDERNAHIIGKVERFA